MNSHKPLSRLPLMNLSVRLILRRTLIAVIYLALFIILDKLTLEFQIMPGVTTWYPPDGLSFGLLLAFGGGLWPVVALASLISGLFVYQFSFPLVILLAWALFTAIGYSVAAEMLRRRVHIDLQLHTLRDAIWLLLAAGIVPGILAAVAVPASVDIKVLTSAQLLAAALHWWIGEVVGILAVTPFLLIYILPVAKKFVDLGWKASLTEIHFSRPTPGGMGKALSLLVALYLAFGVKVLGEFQPLYLLVIPLTWIALQDGITGVSLGIAGANFGTALALLIFPIELNNLPELQLLMIVICVAGLVTGVVVTERRNTRQELQASEERLRSLYENATIGMYRTTPDGQILLANPALVRMLGYSSFEELAQRNLDNQSYEPNYDRSIFRTRMETEGIVQGLHSAWTRKDGTTLFIRESAKATRDAAGKILYYEGTVEDVTDQKQAEKDLKASLERYHRTLDNMLEGCQIIDHDWRYIYVNDAAARQGRRKPDELLMHPMTEIYPGIENTKLFTVLRHCMEERVSDRIENEFVYPDGTTNWFELSIQPVPEGLFILSIDISDRKRAEMVLQQSEERFRALIENSADAITLFDENGLTLYDSPAAPGMLGYHPDEMLGKSVFDLIHPDDASYTKDLFQRIASDPNGRAESIFRVCHKNGSWIWIEAVVTNLISEPSVQAIVANYRDITERVRSEEKIQRQLSHLGALRDIDTSIASSFSMDISLAMVLTQVMSQLGVDAACVLLFNPITNSLSYAAGRGFLTPDFAQGKVLRLGEGYAGEAALERRTIHVTDLPARNDNPRLQRVLPGEHFVEYYGVPLLVKGHINGVLEIFCRSPLDPDQDWLDFLQTLAGQAAIAIDNATLFENLQRSNAELNMAYDATIEGWSHALDLRDKETEGHTQRVTDMTVRLAKGFGFSDAEIVHIRRGALLHDIGKMGVPDRILLKPGALTDEEWVAMKKHPTFAYEMLSPIKYLRPAIDIPYCHHEKWDGTGYPRGLKSDEIPLAARIFAAIDIYDALTSDRPYRPAWPKEKVLDHIQSLSGTHLDPQVVEFFLKQIKETD